MKSQNKRLLSALHRSPLTTLDIISLCGIVRPAARIKDLRDAGHEIATTMVKKPNRFGEETRVARYSL